MPLTTLSTSHTLRKRVTSTAAQPLPAVLATTCFADEATFAKTGARSAKPLSRTRSSLYLARRAHELECGVDEVARGCLFGRVYAGAVVFAPPAPGAKATDPVPPPPLLPKGIVIRDSKTMSKAQRERAAAWVHEHAYAVSVVYKDETYVDAHNILRAAQDAMGDAVRGAQAVVAAKAAAARAEVQTITVAVDDADVNAATESPPQPPPPPTRIDRLLVDGHVFAPQPSVGVPSLCIVKGDATYFSIACAAIVAKVAHDAYVQALCDAHPKLDAWYDLRRNVGYGTTKHRQGLVTHGTTPFHRKTFGGCKGVRAAEGWEGVQAGDQEKEQEGVVT